MRIRRDFEQIYREQQDPWEIGNADGPRYDLYRRLLLARVRGGSLLDIGCGLGAFLARFADEFDTLTGVETAYDAVTRGRALRPEIEFVHSGAEHLANTALDDRSFDAIVVSDVLYYLRQPSRAGVLRWTADHLGPGGHALVAAWCPGGRYFEPDELRALVRGALAIVDDVVLPSEHVALMARQKRRLAAFASSAITGTIAVPTDVDSERVAERALAALPREPTPEQVRRRSRLERLRLLHAADQTHRTGDELVTIVGEAPAAARVALERRGFALVSPEELADAAAGT